MTLKELAAERSFLIREADRLRRERDDWQARANHFRDEGNQLRAEVARLNSVARLHCGLPEVARQYEAERDEARSFAREVLEWADSYVPDNGWGEGWAEVIARSKALDWLKG